MMLVLLLLLLVFWGRVLLWFDGSGGGVSNVDGGNEMFE